MNTSFVSGLRLDFDIFDVTSVIGEELSDNMGELFLFEKVPAMLKKIKKNRQASDKVNGTDEASHLCI